VYATRAQVRLAAIRDLRKHWVLRSINRQVHILWGVKGFGNSVLGGR